MTGYRVYSSVNGTIDSQVFFADSESDAIDAAISYYATVWGGCDASVLQVEVVR